jgi:hypothetical protein
MAVTADVFLANADCTEDFDLAESTIEPGTVVIVDERGTVEGCGPSTTRAL